MPIRSSAGVNWAGIVLPGRDNADLHPDEDLPYQPFLCCNPVLPLPWRPDGPYGGGQKYFSMTVGIHVSGGNGKWSAFSVPTSGTKHSPCVKGPFRLPGSTKVWQWKYICPCLLLFPAWATTLPWNWGCGVGFVPAPFSLGECSPGSWQQLWLFTASRASQHSSAMQDISPRLPRLLIGCHLALSFHIWA